jgi:predicted nuclease with RNAse H fold
MPGGVRLIGIDCATDPAKVGLALGHWEAGRISLVAAGPGGTANRMQTTLVSWLAEALEPVLVAVDAPLGWPAALGDGLAQHVAGLPLRGRAHDLFRRETDRFLQRTLRKTPLDVGADRIARTAHAALGLLGELGQALGHPVPLAWDPGTLAPRSALEVYPAATLAVHGLPDRGYKAPDQRPAREAILAGLRTRMDLSIDAAPLLAQADVLDAVVCLRAAADFLEGVCCPPEDLELARKEGWIWVRRREAS